MQRSLFWLAAIAVFIRNATSEEQVKCLICQLGRIPNGNIVQNSNYPYIVSVRIWGTHYCGGSIISERVILTAAHCLQLESNPHNYSIQYGVTNIGGTNNIIFASSLLKHPKFDISTMDYDVGLIYLSKAIELGICARRINLATYKPKARSPVSVTGWGAIQEGGAMQEDLRVAIIHTIPQSECLRKYKHFKITPRMLCAGESFGGLDACSGDSGGPLVFGGVQVGIVSFGIGCGEKEHPGVYTNVAAVRSWITRNMNPKEIVTKKNILISHKS